MPAIERQSTTMPRFIAFLRAINVGGRTVKMDFLRKAFEPLGFSNVETFIASGNVIFESRAKTAQRLEKMIESQLQESLRYEVITFIRSAAELADIARYRPFASSELEADYHALYVAFLPAQPSGEAEQKLMSCRTEDDDFHIQGREAYWLCRKKFSESAFNGAMLEKLLGMPSTMRNATTVRKLSAKYPD